MIVIDWQALIMGLRDFFQWETLGHFFDDTDSLLTTARICSYILIGFVFLYKSLTRWRFRWFHACMSLVYVGAVVLSAATVFAPDIIPTLRQLQTPHTILAALLGVYYLFAENIPE